MEFLLIFIFFIFLSVWILQEKKLAITHIGYIHYYQNNRHNNNATI